MLRKSTVFLAKFSRRNLSYSNVKKSILSSEFSLDKEWLQRHDNMKKLSIGGNYEWIAAVQKKFIGGGKASAVDVDAAACGAEERDQINDILDLVYKLRHTNNATDFLPSTEYAVLRLLLKHNAISEMFKILNDPINYGVFPNEHIACLAIDYFISRKDFISAARIASIVMQQEMFDSPLLNYLSVFSLVKFVELPFEERKMSEDILTVNKPFEEDDESPTFRYPYLKNKWNDNHFDIEDSNLFKNGKFIKTWEGDDDDKDKSLLTDIMSKIGDNVSESGLLSDDVMKEFNYIKNEEETRLIDKQKKNFNLWNNRREELLKIQAEKLKLQLRLEEINQIKNKLNHEKELLFFFENRTTWELKAAEKTKLFEDMKVSP